MMSRQLLVVPQSRKSIWPSWEERRTMTAKQLIVVMGSLHVNHPDFVQRPRSLLPVPNCAGVQPVIQYSDISLLGQLRMIIQWVMK
jgi:hypothetical protein